MSEPETSSAPRIPTVLLVEDDEATRRVLARLLSLSGFQVTENSDGDSALESLKASAPPDIVLSDMMIEGSVDGLEIVRKASTLIPRPAIAVLTGLSAQEAKQAIGRLPVDRLFLKPMQSGEIVRELTALVAGKRGASVQR